MTYLRVTCINSRATVDASIDPKGSKGVPKAKKGQARCLMEFFAPKLLREIFGTWLCSVVHSPADCNERPLEINNQNNNLQLIGRSHNAGTGHKFH
jgi:hypothetical protein